MTATTEATIKYSGWYRSHRRARWQKLATGDNYHDCWAELLARIPKQGKGGESLVLSTNCDPNSLQRPK